MPELERTSATSRDDQQRRPAAFLAALALTAFGAAGFAVVFRLALGWWYARAFGATDVVDAVASLPTALRWLPPVAGGLAAGLIARWGAPARQGVSNVMEAVVLGRITLSLRATLARVAASAIAIAGGMSIGREGPLIEFGGSWAVAVSRVVAMSHHQTRILVAAGTAAGFAAAYNTPFAAVLFVLETIIGVATPAALLPAVTATALATLVTRAAVGAGPIYGQRTFTTALPSDLVALVVLGTFAAVVAASFKRCLAMCETAAERYLPRQPWRAMVGGLVVGALIVGVPSVAGNGYEPLNQLLDRPALATTLVVLLVAKIVATSASVASGVPGGLFTPMLLCGAVVGSLWSGAVAWMVPSVAPDYGAYALVGMAAMTAASIHAPVTAAVLVFELSGDYALALPLMLATTLATTVSIALGSESIYDAELRRRGLGWEVTLDGRRVTTPAPPLI